YGMGLFETFCTYGGRPFLLERHLRRLTEGCEQLAIDYKPDAEELYEQIAMLLRENELEDAYIRLSVSAGSEALGLPTASYSKPNVILYMKELPPRDPSAAMGGKPLQLLRTRRNTPEGAVRLKSFHYMNNIGAKREMLDYPWARGAEGLFLDQRGFAAEGIVSNLFLVRNGMLCTPHLDTGILPGITRGIILELAERIALPAEEGFYNWNAVLASDEIFVTNSIQEIVPIGSCFDLHGEETVIGNRLKTERIGPWTLRLKEAYQSLIEAK
ncbi:MAG: 4-amino-4-deoxychorismate lyase, partial [Paenibacillus sp.]|nr:4-amino-4-deoxychorismate lyase [Paenibacillus sp.]